MRGSRSVRAVMTLVASGEVDLSSTMRSCQLEWVWDKRLETQSGRKRVWL